MKKNVLDNPGELGQVVEKRRLDKKIAAFDEAVRYRQVMTIDKNGEVVADVTRRVVRQNGSGFVISYTEKMIDFLKKVSTPAIIRIFFFIAHRQGYGENGIYGYRCSRKYLQEVLHLSKPSVWAALNYLIDNFLVVENKFDGQTEFMVNPDYVTMGQNKQQRLREWSQRWQWYFKAKDAKRRKKDEG